MSDIYTDPPQSRNEAIIKSTIDGIQYTDPPQSRMEDLLLELKEAIEQGGGGGTTVVANPEGEATDDLEKLQVGNEIYEIPKDYEDLDNKPSINSVELDGNKTASDLGLQTELKGAQTLSGNPITITDAEAMNAESVVVELEPKQDLHGYDAPWVGGAGKNKLDEDYSTNYTNAVKLPAGTYYYQGFVGDVPSHTNTRLEFSEDNSTWEMVGIPSTDARITTSGWDGGWLESGIATMTFTTTAELYFRVWIVEGTLDNRHLSISSEQLTTFAPYSNICPISGYSEVNVERLGKNYYDQSKAQINRGVGQDGTLTVLSGDNAYASDYMNVNPLTTYKYIAITSGGAGAVGIAFYDSDKNVLSWSSVNDVNANNYNITSPSNAVFARCTMYINDGHYGYFGLESDYTGLEPYQGSTATISLGGTKYGGTLDVTNGVLTVDRAEVDLGDLSWGQVSTNTSGKYRYQATVSDMNSQSTVIASGYGEVSLQDTYRCNDGIYAGENNVIIYDSTKDTLSASDFKTAVTGQQLVYELATPLTIQLTPTQIQMLENTNNISTDGTNITLKYQPNNVIGECKVYTDEKCSKVLPPLPTTDGTYHLSCEMTSGVGVLSWVSDS